MVLHIFRIVLCFLVGFDVEAMSKIGEFEVVVLANIYIFGME